MVEEHSILKKLLRRPYIRYGISANKIPCKVVQTQRSIFNGFLSLSVEIAGDDNDLRLIPDDVTVCALCSHEFDPVQWSEKKKLVTLKNIFEVLDPDEITEAAPKELVIDEDEECDSDIEVN
eukprot:gene13380-14750_t